MTREKQVGAASLGRSAFFPPRCADRRQTSFSGGALPRGGERQRPLARDCRIGQRDPARAPRNGSCAAGLYRDRQRADKSSAKHVRANLLNAGGQGERGHRRTRENNTRGNKKRLGRQGSSCNRQEEAPLALALALSSVAHRFCLRWEGGGGNNAE